VRRARTGRSAYGAVSFLAFTLRKPGRGDPSRLTNILERPARQCPSREVPFVVRVDEP
jgi:hypothetical protein